MIAIALIICLLGTICAVYTLSCHYVLSVHMQLLGLLLRIYKHDRIMHISYC